MVCVGVEGEWCDLSEGAVFFSFSGYGMGVFYGWWGFSRALKILFGCIIQMIVFGKFCIYVISFYCVEMSTFTMVL